MACGSESLTGHSRNSFVHQTLNSLGPELPKSSEGASGGLKCALNFRAREMISMVYSFSCTEIMASALEELPRAL
jgi:hypothetical protein